MPSAASASTSRRVVMGDAPSSALQRQVFVRRRIGEPGNPIKIGLADPRSDAIDERQLPEMRADDALIEDLLHPGQDLRTLAVVQLDRLLLEHRIEIGVIAIGVGATLHDEGLEPRRCVAERSAARLYDVLQFPIGKLLVERDALKRSQLRPYADRAKI